MGLIASCSEAGRTHERSYEYLQTCRADACRGQYRIGQRTQRPAPRHREGQAQRNLRNLDSANRGFSASGPGRGIHRSSLRPTPHRAELGWVLAVPHSAYSCAVFWPASWFERCAAFDRHLDVHDRNFFPPHYGAFPKGISGSVFWARNRSQQIIRSPRRRGLAGWGEVEA